MKYTTALLLLVSSINSFAEAEVKPAKVMIPIFSQKIAFKLPLTWKTGSENRSDNSYMIELIPINENIESWQSLIVIQGFKGLAKNITPDKYIATTVENYKGVCGKDLIYEALDKTVIDGFSTQIAILGCAKLPNANTGEVSYWTVIQGSNDLYVIQKAVRFSGKNPLTRANAHDFIAMLLPIELCSAGGEKLDCNK
ncbi:MAG: hypothetical protein WBP13_03805 [Methylophilaceae bacterium]